MDKRIIYTNSIIIAILAIIATTSGLFWKGLYKNDTSINSRPDDGPRPNNPDSRGSPTPCIHLPGFKRFSQGKVDLDGNTILLPLQLCIDVIS